MATRSTNSDTAATKSVLTYVRIYDCNCQQLLHYASSKRHVGSNGLRWPQKASAISRRNNILKIPFHGYLLTDGRLNLSCRDGTTCAPGLDAPASTW
jgi:hypothetical protein